MNDLSNVEPGPSAPTTVGNNRWRSRLCLAVLAAVALLAGCTPDEPGPAQRDHDRPRSQPAVVPLPVGMSEHAIRIDGRTRTYHTHRPQAGNDPVPLVVVLHGAGGSGKQAAKTYGWIPLADDENFVVAFPDGYKRAWHASDRCCGAPVLEGVDDVAFIRALVTDVGKRLPIDPDRVFVAGISNGGILAYRLACETTLFAAVGAVSTTMIGDCASPAPVSLLHIHGTKDETIPYDGGPGRRDNGGTGRLPVHIDGPAIPDLVARWRAIDRCSEPEVLTAGAVTTTTADCADGRVVELVTIADAGHQWPASRPNPPLGPVFKERVSVWFDLGRGVSA
jgi:polyhydroxybutyrate depolymerase